jgi:hypothetical protein
MDTTMVNKIVAELKKRIKAKKEKYADHPSWSVDLMVISHRTNGQEFYSIRIGGWNGTDFGKLSRYEVKTIATDLKKQLVSLKGVRGWSHLGYEVEDILPSRIGWDSEYISFPNMITLLADPCKEFKSLASYLQKYCARSIAMDTLYSVHIGGKRGRVYGEEGDRYYLCHKPKKCETLLAELRKARGSKDKVSTKIVEVDEIDPWELEVSIRNEVEFDGVRHKRLVVTFTTPSGKKKEVKL